VGIRRLEDYLRAEWLLKICTKEELETTWAALMDLCKAGRVWLLLDGLDEMPGDSLRAIDRDLKEDWARNLRVIVTCRLNQWDADGNNLINSFEVYQTLEYEDLTSTGKDRVLEFITKWFEDEATATRIRSVLDEPGKERIEDLVRNPLRLTLLCASWEEKQALPDTQADLYERFVNYIYRWKRREFRTEFDRRPDLDLALGKLALVGLNRQANSEDAVRRFRFTEGEIKALWRERADTLLTAVDRLGWLVKIGTEAGADVYAFYHPTFQEYFAACCIDDWDYFLPRAHKDRPVPCQGETEPTYRLFEKEWRQVILLWMGRRDITDNLKEELIDKLTDFNCREGDFYVCQAYCMAAICVGEFKSSDRVDEIVERIVLLAFGCFDTDLQNWIKCLDPIESLAREIIPFTHRQKAIDSLLVLLNNPTLEDSLRNIVTEAIGRIAVGNRQAIDSLLAMLDKPNLSDSLHSSVAESLGQIAVKDRQAIDSLLAILENSTLDDSLRYVLAYVLGQIAVKDRQAIDSLLAILENPDLSDWLRCRVATPLGQIAVNDRQTIDSLLVMLDNPTLGDSVRYMVAMELNQIDVGNQQAIDSLVMLLENPALSNSLRCNVAQNLGLLDVGNRQAIDLLVAMLDNLDLDVWLCCDAAIALSQIDVGNRQAIDSLVMLLDHPSKFLRLDTHVEEALGRIAVNDRQAIDSLLAMLDNPVLDDSARSKVARVLGQIAVGDRQAIDSLLAMLGNLTLSDRLRLDVAGALGGIDLGNRQAIDSLLAMLDSPDPGIGFFTTLALGHTAVGDRQAIDSLLAMLDNPAKCLGVARELVRMMTTAAMPSAIQQLRKYVTDEVYNSHFKQFQECYKVLFHCAQTLSYPIFHAAWHQTNLPIIPFDPTTLHRQLNRPHIAILDLSDFHSARTEDIAIELTTRIYITLERPIPTEIDSIPKLKRVLINLKLSPHFVLIGYNPSADLVKAIDRLRQAGKIQTIWLSDDNSFAQHLQSRIDGALPLEQADLAAAIWAAIDRFVETAG
jgi:hypothetical protein